MMNFEKYLKGFQSRRKSIASMYIKLLKINKQKTTADYLVWQFGGAIDITGPKGSYQSFEDMM